MKPSTPFMELTNFRLFIGSKYSGLLMSDKNGSSINRPDWFQSPILQGMTVLLLWLISAAFSLYTLFEFQQMIFRVYILCCSQNRWGFSVTRQWSAIILIGVWLAFTIITGEYHYQNARSKKSWKLFLKSYIIIAIFLVLAWIIA